MTIRGIIIWFVVRNPTGYAAVVVGVPWFADEAGKMRSFVVIYPSSALIQSQLTQLSPRGSINLV